MTNSYVQAIKIAFLERYEREWVWICQTGAMDESLGLSVSNAILLQYFEMFGEGDWRLNWSFERSHQHGCPVIAVSMPFQEAVNLCLNYVDEEVADPPSHILDSLIHRTIDKKGEAIGIMYARRFIFQHSNAQKAYRTWLTRRGNYTWPKFGMDLLFDQDTFTKVEPIPIV